MNAKGNAIAHKWLVHCPTTVLAIFPFFFAFVEHLASGITLLRVY